MRTILGLAVVSVLFPLGVALAQDEAVKKEAEKLQGTWEILSSEEDDRPTPEVIVQNLKVVIKGNQLTLKGVEQLINQFGKVTLTIDPATMPKIIDFKVEAGMERDKTFEGIYTLKDDELKICASTRSGGNRPEEFKTQAGSNRLLVVLKRASE